MNTLDITLMILCGLSFFSSNRAIKHHERNLEAEKTKNAFLTDENQELKGIVKELEKLLDSNKRNSDLGDRLMNFSVHIFKSSGIMEDEDIEKLFRVKKPKSLEDQLKEAEASENFEEATRLRDLINSKNKGNG